MNEHLVLVLHQGTCETCGKQGQALFHHRLSRGPLACLECWEKRLETNEQTTEHEEATE
jgi:hypothetical protein